MLSCPSWLILTAFRNCGQAYSMHCRLQCCIAKRCKFYRAGTRAIGSGQQGSVALALSWHWPCTVYRYCMPYAGMRRPVSVKCAPSSLMLTSGRRQRGRQLWPGPQLSPVLSPCLAPCSPGRPLAQ